VASRAAILDPRDRVRKLDAYFLCAKECDSRGPDPSAWWASFATGGVYQIGDVQARSWMILGILSSSQADGRSSDEASRHT
jgi:hypothetical protein